MNVLDLFSGIGGFSLGLERAGMRTVAFCEIEPWCRAVLAKHWPHVPCYPDIRELDTGSIKADLICGGFPCQDVSIAGDRAGLDGERSGLWFQLRRCIRELRPRLVVVENTTGLLDLGMAVVLGDLAALGYDVVWHCIPAAAAGAAHPRDRVWIIAHYRGERWADGTLDHAEHARQVLSDINRELALSLERQGEQQSYADPLACVGARVPDGGSARAAYVGAALCGKLHGLPDHLDALKALGNAVFPAIPEIIGRAIMSSIARDTRGKAGRSPAENSNGGDAGAPSASPPGVPIASRSSNSASNDHGGLARVKAQEEYALGALSREIELHNETRAALERMVKAFKPFTIKPIGAPNSIVRAEQDEQIEAHEQAMRVLYPASSILSSHSKDATR